MRWSFSMWKETHQMSAEKLIHRTTLSFSGRQMLCTVPALLLMLAFALKRDPTPVLLLHKNGPRPPSSPQPYAGDWCRSDPGQQRQDIRRRMSNRDIFARGEKPCYTPS